MGFDAIDVHSWICLRKEPTSKDFRGLVACGGFSYGDVLEAGSSDGDAPFLFNTQLRDIFSEYFVKELIPLL